jgi:hypothetical protein
MTYRFEHNNTFGSYLGHVCGEGTTEREALEAALLCGPRFGVWLRKGGGYEVAVDRVQAAEVAAGILGGKGGWRVICTIAGEPNHELWFGRGVAVGAPAA